MYKTVDILQIYVYIMIMTNGIKDLLRHSFKGEIYETII